MEKPKSNQGDNLAAVAVKSYWVALWDRAANSYSSKIVNAPNAEQAQIEAVRTINIENEYGPDDDAGFVAVAAYERTELLALAAEMEAEDKAATSTQAPKNPDELESRAVPPARTSLMSKIALARAAQEHGKAEALPPLIEEEHTAPNLNTYLVKYGTRTTGMGDYRDNFSTGLIRAVNLYAAYDSAMKSHVAEAFDEDREALPGEWVEVESESGVRLAFEFDNNRCDVDAGCVLWVEEVIEVEPEDVATIERYLQDW